MTKESFYCTSHHRGSPLGMPEAMNVKAQALLNAVKWVEEQHGSGTLGDIIRRCSPPVRERYISGIAIEWHPQHEFVEFLHHAEAVIRQPRGAVSKAIGAEGARINTRSMTKRAVMYVASPEFLLRRIASLWHQFNDQGDMRVLGIDDRHADIELAALPNPDDLFCATITGWSEVIGAAIGFDRPRSEHISCRARGDQQCIWRVAFTPVSATIAPPAPGR